MRELRNERLYRSDRGIASERSLGELFGQLSEDVSLLVRQEMQLAKVEMNEKIARARKDLIAVGSGAMVAYLGALALVGAVILFLTQVVGIRAWLSALLVGAAFAIGGYYMLQRGLRDMGRIDPKPRRTVESVRDDIRSVKELRS